MYKQAIVLRKDLKWGKGKLATHAAHAAVSAVFKTDKRILDEWEREGAKKVVLKVNDLKELKDIYKKCKQEKITCVLVKDAGKTQLKRGTETAVALGPAKEKEINKITGKLKLL